MKTQTGNTVLLDGKKISGDIKSELRIETEKLLASGYRAPHLVAILVGNNPASQTYVSSKIKSCEFCGYRSTLIQFEADITEAFLLEKLEELNNQEDVDGILVQLPLPSHISEFKIIDATAPEKDVDGFHPENIGRMAKNLPTPLPATPGGVIELLKRYNIPTFGKYCVVVGRSNIVGSPMSILMGRDAEPGNCTVTLTHIYTENLEYYTRTADILIVATGVVGLIKADMVKPGAVVIDVGISKVPDPQNPGKTKIVGDVEFDEVAPLCSFITPVPGGVGPMTIAILLQNTMRLYKERLHIS